MLIEYRYGNIESVATGAPHRVETLRISYMALSGVKCSEALESLRLNINNVTMNLGFSETNIFKTIASIINFA